MSDEPAKFILGDTAINAGGEHPDGKRGFFGRRRRRRQAPLTHCENCGAQLTGRYCAQCGQPAIDYRRSFRHVLVDVLDSFLNWDSKFFATIWWLIVRPWRLTNEFLAGHRVRYLHPVRLYLLASILFFFALSYLVKSINVKAPENLSPEIREEIKTELDKENLTPEQRNKINKALKFTNVTPRDVIAKEVAKTADKIKKKDAKRALMATPSPSVTPAASASPEESPKEEADKESNDDDDSVLQFGSSDSSDQPKNKFAKWMQERAKAKIGEHGTNAQLFFVGFISNLPYMVLCCIPLFAFVLKILYIRKGIYYIDHLVYALHIHTFAYTAIILIGLITMGLNRVAHPVLAGWLIGLLWLTFTVQIFLSIRRVYRQSWFLSIFKFFIGGWVYLIVLFIALGITFFITLALP
jgi:Protein of unknown function (DUF3667).